MGAEAISIGERRGGVPPAFSPLEADLASWSSSPCTFMAFDRNMASTISKNNNVSMRNDFSTQNAAHVYVLAGFVLFCFVSFPKQDFLEIKYLNEDVNMYILSGDFALGQFYRTIKETAF